jgi:putative transcription factor
LAVCEMCGREAGKLLRVKIENAVMMVGPECARFGKAVDAPPAVSRAIPKGRKIVPGTKLQASAAPSPRKESADALDSIGELAPDYPKRIMKARNSLGLKQEELAAKLNEKKSVIRDLEAGTLVPTDALIRKLEKQLKITLIEEAKHEYTVPQAKRRELTLGDFIEK